MYSMRFKYFETFQKNEYGTIKEKQMVLAVQLKCSANHTCWAQEPIYSETGVKPFFARRNVLNTDKEFFAHCQL